MRRNKAVVMGVIFTLGVGVLAGCAKSSPVTQGAEVTTQPPADASGSESITLKFAYDDSESQPYYAGISAFKEMVEEKTEGKVNVEIYPNAQLGNARDTIEGLSLGTVDCVFASTAGVSQFVPEFSIMDAPFLFNDAEHADACVDGKLGEKLKEAAQTAQKIKILGFMDTGFRHVFSKKNIEDLSGFKGVKIRTMESEIQQATFDSLGAIATPMASSEVFTALQQGTIDAAENSFSYILNKKMYENCDYVIKTGHSYAFACIMISDASFAKLTEEQQKIVLEAGDHAIEVERESVAKMNDESEKKLQDELGVKMIDIDRDQLREAVQPLYEKYAELLNPELVEIVKSYE